jgi:multisubunit Na+/H+ antiporter MnhE subunit
MKIIRKTYYIFAFLLFYLQKLVRANLLIAWDILTPGDKTRPGFLQVPLEIQSDLGLLLFSNLLSMTPGTLCIDISSDRKYLLVHVLIQKQEEELMDEIMEIQARIKRIKG